MYTGPVHADAAELLFSEHPDAERSGSEFVEGFATSNGRFLNREEAKKLAHERDLLRPGRDKFVASTLWSEFLVHGTLSEERRVVSTE
ncbi:MAG TPA: hypothetical protein VMU25_02295 [Candidatus Paceibacterota bacterium]|nr:hypothetical protein [Candidatus Paceibacterota bacterium]